MCQRTDIAAAFFKINPHGHRAVAEIYAVINRNPFTDFSRFIQIRIFVDHVFVGPGFRFESEHRFSHFHARQSQLVCFKAFALRGNDARLKLHFESECTHNHGNDHQHPHHHDQRRAAFRPTPPFRHPSAGGDLFTARLMNFRIPSAGGVAAGRGGFFPVPFCVWSSRRPGLIIPYP